MSNIIQCGHNVPPSSVQYRLWYNRYCCFNVVTDFWRPGMDSHRGFVLWIFLSASHNLICRWQPAVVCLLLVFSCPTFVFRLSSQTVIIFTFNGSLQFHCSKLTSGYCLRNVIASLVDVVIGLLLERIRLVMSSRVTNSSLGFYLYWMTSIKCDLKGH